MTIKLPKGGLNGFSRPPSKIHSFLSFFSDLLFNSGIFRDFLNVLIFYSWFVLRAFLTTAHHHLIQLLHLRLTNRTHPGHFNPQSTLSPSPAHEDCPHPGKGYQSHAQRQCPSRTFRKVPYHNDGQMLSVQGIARHRPDCRLRLAQYGVGVSGAYFMPTQIRVPFEKLTIYLSKRSPFAAARSHRSGSKVWGSGKISGSVRTK